jgi:flagellin
MALSILNNIAGVTAQNQLSLNSVNLNRTLLRLASGKRINSGADDAAGLQIADGLRANVRALDQAVRNANDGISVAQIADGAVQEVTYLLTRAFSLAEQAATGTVDAAGRQALDDELTSIRDEIDRISDQSNYNGVKLMDATATAISIFVGDLSGAGTSISVTFTEVSSSSIGVDATDISALDLTTADGAATALSTLSEALLSAGKVRAALGAGMNRLQSAVAVLQNMSQNTLAAESNIRDANMAEEISNMTKYQILSQSGIAALTQANSSAQTVLALLRQ